MSEYASPILEKREPQAWDHRPITWSMFVRLLAWAKQAAQEEHVSIYLVGSAVTKGRPRDIDIGVRIPLAEFEERFSVTVPHDAESALEFLSHFGRSLAWHKMWGRLHTGAWGCTDGRRHVDLKIAPDVWWADKPRLLLASPESVSTDAAQAQ